MNSIIYVIIVFALLASLFILWFVFQWIKQTIAHNKYLAGLRMGDKIKFIDEDINYCDGKFWRIKDGMAEIFDAEGNTFKINTFQIIIKDE